MQAITQLGLDGEEWVFVTTAREVLQVRRVDPRAQECTHIVIGHNGTPPM